MLSAMPIGGPIVASHRRALLFITTPEVVLRAAGAMAPPHVMAAPVGGPIVAAHRRALLFTAAV